MLTRTRTQDPIYFSLPLTCSAYISDAPKLWQLETTRFSSGTNLGSTSYCAKGPRQLLKVRHVSCVSHTNTNATRSEAIKVGQCFAMLRIVLIEIWTRPDPPPTHTTLPPLSLPLLARGLRVLEVYLAGKREEGAGRWTERRIAHFIVERRTERGVDVHAFLSHAFPLLLPKEAHVALGRKAG